MREPFYACPEGLISREMVCVCVCVGGGEVAGTPKGREGVRERMSKDSGKTVEIASHGQIAIIRHTGTYKDRVEDVCSQWTADALVMWGQE